MMIAEHLPGDFEAEPPHGLLGFDTQSDPEPPASLDYRIDLPKPDPDVAKAIARDFYLSFKFSQGEGLVQHYLLGGLKRHYQRTWPSDKLEQLPHAMRNLIADMQRMKPPTAHIPASEVALQMNFSAQQDMFSSILQDRPPDFPLATRLKAWLKQEAMGGIGHAATVGIIDRDLHYAERGRPNRDTPKDRYASYFRDYVLAGKPTRSPGFDAMFKDMQAAHLDRGDGALKAHRLAHMWEARFPGEQFYDDPALERIKAAPARVQAIHAAAHRLGSLLRPR